MGQTKKKNEQKRGGKQKLFLEKAQEKKNTQKLVSPCLSKESGFGGVLKLNENLPPALHT